MSSRHLSCEGCRIRVRASAPEIGLLEGRCPICGVKLSAVPFPSGVLGFRSFDLDALSDQASSDRPAEPAPPVDLVARRTASLVRDALDTDRWTDEGGTAAGEAAGRVAGGPLIVS